MASFPAHRVAGYLAQRVRFGMKFGLETMRALVAEMGHPERAFPALLVAGTNGKGSVAATCDAALRASGLRTGRYTSPHLVRLSERITVDGREIGARDLAAAVSAVRDAARCLVRRGVLEGHPTFFEVLTAAAFEHFRRKEVDVAVLEVGLGGRLDATNVVEPVASAIVSVDFDHEVYLGRTLAAIAGEKAGVLRAGRATVVGPLPDEARRAVLERARAIGARVVDATGTPLPPGLVPLPGAHQEDNLRVAVRLLEEAKAAGVAVRLDRLPAATRATRWPGRLERVPGHPPLLLDGAHNPAGARALARHLRGGPDFVLLFGAMADKDVRGLARELFPLASGLVLTRAPLARAAAPGELARRAGRLARGAILVPTVGRALARAKRLARAHEAGTIVVVAGSLYLVGAVKAITGRARGAGGRRRSAPASPTRRGRPRARRSGPPGRGRTSRGSRSSGTRARPRGRRGRAARAA